MLAKSCSRVGIITNLRNNNIITLKSIIKGSCAKGKAITSYIRYVKGRVKFKLQILILILADESISIDKTCVY